MAGLVTAASPVWVNLMEHNKLQHEDEMRQWKRKMMLAMPEMRNQHRNLIPHRMQWLVDVKQKMKMMMDMEPKEYVESAELRWLTDGDCTQG